MRVTAIGDSIVDTEGRNSVTVTTQWLYKLMQALGEQTISIEPLPEYSKTPDILPGHCPGYPALADGDLNTYVTFTDTSLTFDFTTWYPSGTPIFAVRMLTQETAFTCKVYTSADGTTWDQTPFGYTQPYGIKDITGAAGHGAGWSFVSWYPYTSSSLGSYRNIKKIRLDITGTLTISQLQIVANTGSDRWSCLDKLVGTNYIFNNVGLGSENTTGALARFRHDVIDLGSDVCILLCGINDIYQTGSRVEDVQANLQQIYDLADANGVQMLPCTLLPYTPSSLTQDRFNEIRNKIEALNSWIRTTAAVRRYNLCDWYHAMEDPAHPGTMTVGPIASGAMSNDGIHLSIEGNARIVEAFDLSVFTEVTHDFYATPLVAISFLAYRVGDSVFFEFENGVDTRFRIYAKSTPGITSSDKLIADTRATTFSYEAEPGSWYRVYGVDTGVWSAEVYVGGKSASRGSNVLTPFPMMLGR